MRYIYLGQTLYILVPNRESILNDKHGMPTIHVICTVARYNYPRDKLCVRISVCEPACVQVQGNQN